MIELRVTKPYEPGAISLCPPIHYKYEPSLQVSPAKLDLHTTATSLQSRTHSNHSTMRYQLRKRTRVTNTEPTSLGHIGMIKA
jgi:hypothetical protein